jgi:hypothetical protein
MMSANELGSPAYAPTEQDVAFFQEHGYWISPVIIPGTVLDTAERGMARFYAEDVDEHLALDGLPPKAPTSSDKKPYSHWGWRPADGNVMRKNDYTTLRVRELAQLAQYPAIAMCAARLSGKTNLRLWHDQLLYKPLDAFGDTGNVSWHTDRYYWMTCSSEDMLTAWAPFAAVTKADGAMSVVDGSHHWTDELDTQWHTAPFSAIDKVLEQRHATLTPIELKRGQVSYHHCKTLHGSGPNLGTAPRRSLVVHFQPSENRFVERGRYHPNDDLVRKTGAGLPDYSDPQICPTLFPSPPA